MQLVPHFPCTPGLVRGDGTVPPGGAGGGRLLAIVSSEEVWGGGVAETFGGCHVGLSGFEQ